MSTNTAIKKSKSSKDLTVGEPLKIILLFTLPIFLSNILQQLYNLTDIAIIGHKLGDDALSAIGSVSIICDMFNSCLFGMGNGFSVVISRYFGANDQKKMKQAIFNTTLVAIAWIVFITLTATLSLKPLMRLLNTPDELFDTAHSYASIVLALLVFPFVYNVLSGMLRAIGNSVAPLVFLGVSVTTNIILDFVFVYIFDSGLPGAAIATVISQGICIVICFVYIITRVPELHFGKEDMIVDTSMMSDLFTSGLAFALMFTIVQFGTVTLQGAINGFGKATIAAHTTARKISSLCMMTLSTLATAMASYTGQNYGAGRHDRIREGLTKILKFSFIIDAALIVFIYTLGSYLVSFISGSTNSEVINTAVFYLKVDLPFYFVLSILLITRMTLQGMGAKWSPLIASLMELSLKVITAKWLAKLLGYTGVAICEPITWFVCAIYILIIFFNNENINKNKKIAN